MKNKKIKSTNYPNEDMKEIKTLIIITLIILAAGVGLYFLTEKALNKKNDDLTEATISYTETIVGEMFDKPYDEYYIFAYGAKDKNAAQYETLINNYGDKEKSIKVYYVNMDSKFNSFALGEKANVKPTKIDEVVINEVALMLIKDGKVTEYFESLSEIEKALS